MVAMMWVVSAEGSPAASPSSTASPGRDHEQRRQMQPYPLIQIFVTGRSRYERPPHDHDEHEEECMNRTTLRLKRACLWSAGFALLILLWPATASAHQCGPGLIELRAGDDIKYIIQANGFTTKYKVLTNSNASVVSIEPGVDKGFVAAARIFPYHFAIQMKMYQFSVPRSPRSGVMNLARFFKAGSDQAESPRVAALDG
jgi:hypothetical protein